MRLRRDGVPLELRRDRLAAAIPGAGRKVLLLVHGSCMNDLLWNRRGHDHGAALARDLGYTAVYLHYDSGLHVSTNGRELASLLERLVAAWPVRVAELSIVAHSMGGLVSRSACHQAGEAGLRWPRRLRKMVFLGTPHHGAPAERLGNWVNVVLGAAPFTGPLARLPRIRSAGVTDLRHGNLLDEDWQGRDRFGRGPDRRRPVPLPTGVQVPGRGRLRVDGTWRADPGRRARPRGQRAGASPRPGDDPRPPALGSLHRLGSRPPRPPRPAGRPRAGPGLDGGGGGTKSGTRRADRVSPR